MMNACLPYEALDRYATGAASQAERSDVEAHASACESCRLTLTAAGLAFEPGSVEEEALVAWMASARPVESLLADLGVTAGSQPEPVPGAAFGGVVRPIRGRTLRRAVGGMVAALAASVALLFVVPGVLDGAPPYRALQGRPAQLTAHTPFMATRGALTPEMWNRIEADSRERGPEAAVAVLLSRGAQGDWERAEALLQKVQPPTGATLNDRGVLLLALGRAPEALAAFDAAIELEPGLSAAWFNRALALEAAGREADSHVAWQAYLDRSAGEDPGWIDEARKNLAR